jgi:hypothetical protein
MADIVIDSVSASYTGTDKADDFQNGTGNLRDITVQGLSGDDLLSFGSAVQAGTGAGGRGLGYSIGSSTIGMGAGQDTVTFSGQAGSGSSKFNSTQFKLGPDDDYLLVNGLVSASASVVKGNEGADEITFLNASGGSTATDVLIAGGAGADVINASWTGTEANSFRVKGGDGADNISGTYQFVSADADAQTGRSGLIFKGNKGDDTISLNILGTADEVNVKGNSGADLIVVTAANDVTDFTIGGGKGADTISAVFANAQSAVGASLQGNDGADVVVGNFISGGFISGFTLGGGEGGDALTLFTNNAALTAGSANSILGGSGSDTITLNLGSNVSVTGASGFVADLGVAGVSAVSGGTAGLQGGVIDLNLSAAMSGQAGAGIFFRGSNSDDVINVTNDSGAGNTRGLTNVTFSAESGADTITLDSQSGGVYSAVAFNGGAGNDIFTAQIGFGSNEGAATGGRISFNGEAGDDSFVVNVASGVLSAAVFDGGAGNDSFVANLNSGGSIGLFNSGTEFLGGTGADTIAIIGSTGSNAAAKIAGGIGNDLITGTFASGGSTNQLTAEGGAGADTIAFTFSAAATAGITINGNSGGRIGGGADADSITVIAAAVTGGTFDFGTLVGGAGADTITFGGQLGNSAGEIGTYTGSINAGAGADSIIFSGNNFFSAGVGIFAGGGAAGSGGFRIASGDSLVGGFDTVFVSNNDVTGGQAQQAGTFGSAGFVFSAYNDAAGGTFAMIVASAGDSAGQVGAIGTGGGQAYGQAIFTSDGIQGAGQAAVATGGVIGQMSAGGVGAAAVGTYIISGASTLGDIFSSVDSVVNGRGKAAVFNVQNGSAGSIDGYLFVDGGTLTDTIVKFDTNALGGQFTRAGNVGFFSAGNAQALVRSRTQNLNSGGQIFFGGNVGVG